ncbi:hypothetical protein BDL97_18G090300 [Sphagnum fallax]|jgi:hypothetical protein|nr:hypothetical protein BDL97_18G090300 [Sphagnum fallax]
MASSKSAAVELKRSDSSVDGIPGTPSIRVTVVQSGLAPDFSIVEKTTWIDGTWSEQDATRHTLTMTGTDVSGILRFMSEGSKPEFFLVALGVDSVRPYSWCDLIVGNAELTGALIHQNYYKAGTPQNRRKNEHHETVSGVLPSGTAINVKYYLADGGNLHGVTINIT